MREVLQVSTCLSFEILGEATEGPGHSRQVVHPGAPALGALYTHIVVILPVFHTAPCQKQVAYEAESSKKLKMFCIGVHVKALALGACV